MRDLSALGSAVVLAIVVAAVTGYLWLRGRGRDALAVMMAAGGGAVLNAALKGVAGRPRPEVVPHLTEVSSSSFPSGHSMLSAIIYLSLGVMVARNVSGKGAAVFVVAVAGALAGVIGCTRVYLGVHYPTDVFAGWAAGVAWMLCCLAGQTWWERSSGGKSNSEH